MTIFGRNDNNPNKGMTIAVADFVYTSESNESCEKHSTQR